ncbi:hypothetical protein DPMN_127835 [Dreissena polymorpha]|uniref:Uncharacterized protein n=1 Tax=Dreissena polymorpha TaxID=45954 RepID=A0A9D4JZJ7_DREPO|nr:hypothetical protein DPMN_127835 [Dreissena polymorpha]
MFPVLQLICVRLVSVVILRTHTSSMPENVEAAFNNCSGCSCRKHLSQDIKRNVNLMLQTRLKSNIQQTKSSNQTSSRQDDVGVLRELKSNIQQTKGSNQTSMQSLMTTINVNSRALSSKTATQPGSHVFQPTGTIFPTPWTINVDSKVLTRQQTKGDHKSST